MLFSINLRAVAYSMRSISYAPNAVTVLGAGEVKVRVELPAEIFSSCKEYFFFFGVDGFSVVN